MLETLETEAASAAVVIVDFDGTLVLLETDWQALRKDLEKFCMVEFQERESFEQLDAGLNRIRKSRGPLAYEKLLEMVSRYEMEGYKGEKITPVVDLLMRLQRTKKIAIFSSNCRRSIERILPELGLKADYILAKEDMISPKSDGAGLRKILSYYAIEPEQAFFIGDGTSDVLAGEAAMVRTFLWKEANA